MTKQQRGSRGNPNSLSVEGIYGYWTILGPFVRRGPNNTAYFPCQCRCGTKKDVAFRYLRQAEVGKSHTSCGCYQREVMATKRTLPGEPGSVEYQKARWLRTTHKLEWSRYLEMLKAQNYACKICLKQRELQVDHDHSCCPGPRSCGECIRGLLCQSCNQGIGFFEENTGTMKRAIAYLSQ